MKDPSSFSRRGKRPKLKLLVSFNGAFCRRPPSWKFRYTGGETRIISLDRNISFSKLKSKITDLISPHAGPTHFSLKYQVSESSSRGGGEEEPQPLLILLESDDDVRCMVEEYEMVESKGKSLTLTRLWVFVCDNITDKNALLSVEGDGIFEGKKGFEEEGIFPSEEDLMPPRTGRNHDSNTSAVTTPASKKYNDDYSLRKMVLRQQLLSKKLDEIRSFCGVAEQSEMELSGENGDCEAPSMESCSEPDSPPGFVSKIVNFGGDFCRKVTDYKYMNALRMTNERFGKVLPVIGLNSRPLNPRDGNLGPGSAVSEGGFLGQSCTIFGSRSSRSLDSLSQSVAAGQPPILQYSSGASSTVNNLEAKHNFRSDERATLSEMNRENIMPWGGNHNLVNDGYLPLAGHGMLTGGDYPLRSSQGREKGQEGYQGGIRDHRFGLSEPRSQRNCPYRIRSRSLATETGNNRNFRLDGRPWVGKFYPRLRSSSNISKPGPVLRSYGDASSKPFSGSRYHKVQVEGGTMDCGRNNHSKMFNLPYSGQENMFETGVCGVLKHERASPVGGGIVYDGACAGANHKFPLAIDAVARSLPNAREVETQMDFLACPGSEQLDIACQAVSAKAFDKVGIKTEAPFDINQEVPLRNQEKVIFSASPDNLCYSSRTELSGDNKPRDKESGHGSNIYQTCAQAFDGHTTSAVDLSLHSLSLATSGALQQASSSAAAGIDISESLLKLQSKDLDLMDEEQLNSGPIVENSTDIASDSSPETAARTGHSDHGKQDSQQNPGANLSIEEKDANKKTDKCLKVGGEFPADVAAFCTHLATRELQNIKNSDLECIKELGSGTFGTVYYGKWKGSDVAIKRIKPSCFTDGAKQEDRLVADFWKEAHILGQLHHPNIVALYGVVTDGPVNSLATVTEYMVNGSLKQVLRRKDRTIDRRKRLIIAMDAAFMEYLHEKNIVHFDLKSHNFLMNMRDPQRPICKIGDLGLSKIKQRTLVSGGVRGTIPWMAPELLNGKNLVSEKVDVYSFGIVMWELLSGEEPYADMRSEEIIGGIIRGNLRPEIPSWCDPAWRSLMERCWSSDPDSRPSFSDIAKELRAMAAAVNIK